MKLRNKKTGEIRNCQIMADGFIVINSLKDLRDWEDYEEDELFYVVSAEHKSGYQCVLKEDYPEICKVAKELGIGFETEKEAKLAVEKLKALKRLKDRGVRFGHYLIDHKESRAVVDIKADDLRLPFDDALDFYNDFALVFGGEL